MIIQGDEEDVEFSIRLRPHQTSTMATTSTWTEFIISNSPDGKAFERNCLGLILVNYEDDGNSREAAAERKCCSVAPWGPKANATSLLTLRSSTPTFPPLASPTGRPSPTSAPSADAVCVEVGKSSCIVEVPNVGFDDTSYSLGSGRPHVVHPGLLDAVIHMAFVAMDVKKPWIPKFVVNVIISINVPWSVGEKFSGFSGARHEGIHCRHCYGGSADTNSGDRDVGYMIWAVEGELGKKLKTTGSALAKLSELINLRYYENPGLTVGEVANSNQVVLPNLDIAPCVFTTTKYKDKKECYEVIILEELLNADGTKPDLLIAPDLSQVDNPAGTLNNQSAEIVILSTNGKSSELEQFETKLIQTLGSRGRKISRLLWNQVPDSAVQDKACISLVEFDKPLLGDLSDEDFSKIKEVVLHASHLTWLTGTDDAKTGGTPTAAMMIGVLRTLRNDLLALEPLSIMIDKSTKTKHFEYSVTITADIFCRKHFGTTSTTTPSDHEFQICSGIPYICRALEDNAPNEILHLAVRPKVAAVVDLLPISATTAKTAAIELAVGKPGLINSVRFEPAANAAEPLDPEDVKIAVAATSLNFREAMTIMGLLPSMKLGLAAAKTVTRLPENMGFEEGASLLVTSYTAWYAIAYIARARKGQSVLIHAGAGGVGQAALQIARHLGLEVFTTVGSTEKRTLVCDVYGVAEDHIFGSRNLDFAKGMKRMTGGRGIDIIVNSLAGESLRRSWEYIAPGGDFVELRLRDTVDNTLSDDRQQLLTEIVRGTMPFLTAGIIKPATPLLKYSIAEIGKGLEGDAVGQTYRQDCATVAVRT
ncbi:hypothetical protein HD806DRAFT_545292 [Xylariaceae sp. AK1471]|nr:hypothetical protein HD806DRAFT_545292 [Xylariaceae sp. AK1471]